jgi:hypothetical protein
MPLTDRQIAQNRRKHGINSNKKEVEAKQEVISGPRRKVGKIAMNFPIPVKVKGYDEMPSKQKTEIIDKIIFKVFKEDFLTISTNIDLLEKFISLRDQYKNDELSEDDLQFGVSAWYGLYETAIHPLRGNISGLALIRNDAINTLVSLIKDSHKQYQFHDEQEKNKKFQKIINEITEMPFVYEMITNCQLLLPGLNDNQQKQVISYCVERYMKILSLFYPILLNELGLAEQICNMIEKSITYNYSAQNIQNYFKHQLVKNICFSFINSKILQYESPTTLVQAIRRDQNAIVSKVLGQTAYNALDLSPAWQDLEKWADKLDKRIQPNLHWKAATAIMVLLLAAFLYEKLSAKSLSIGLGIILFTLVIERYWHKQVSGENTFSKTEIEEALTQANKALSIQKIEIYNSKKEQVNIIMSSMEATKIDPYSSLYNPYQTAPTGPMSFLKYATNAFGISTREAIQLRKNLQQKSTDTTNEEDNNSEAIETAVTYAWFDGAIRSDMKDVVVSQNLAKFHICIDRQNIDASKVAGMDIDALIAILEIEEGPTVGGEGRCIALLPEPIPGKVLINDKPFNVLFTHKVRDPYLNYRLYCYQKPKLEGEGGPTLIVACTVLDDHKVTPTHFSIKNFDTTKLISHEKAVDVKEEDKDKQKHHVLYYEQRLG